MKKKVIFFDGDGTLWYPKTTKRTRKPHWVYHDNTTKDIYLDHIELTPNTGATLHTLNERGIKLVVISANPYAEEIAVREIKEKLNHFKLDGLFYSYRSSQGDDPNGKVAIILEVIDALGLTKADALMVGDSYFYDYLAPKEAGIDAFFIDNTVAKMPSPVPADIQSIQEVEELLGIIDSNN